MINLFALDHKQKRVTEHKPSALLVSPTMESGMKRRNFDCELYVAVDIEKVSAQSLRKTGILP